MTRDNLIQVAANWASRQMRPRKDGGGEPVSLETLQFLTEQLGRQGDYEALEKRIKHLEDKIALIQSVGAQKQYRGL